MWWKIALVRLVHSLFPVMKFEVANLEISRQVFHTCFKFDAQLLVVSFFDKLEINERFSEILMSPLIRAVKSIPTIQTGHFTTNEDIRHGVM